MRKIIVLTTLIVALTTPVYADTTTPPDLWNQVKTWVVQLLDFGPFIDPGGQALVTEGEGDFGPVVEPGGDDPEFGPLIEPGG